MKEPASQLINYIKHFIFLKLYNTANKLFLTMVTEEPNTITLYFIVGALDLPKIDCPYRITWK